MTSLLSRLRRAGRREPTPEHPQPIIEQEQLQIDRRILQDPNACLDSQAEDSLPRGLTPSTRLPSRHRAKPTDPQPESQPQSSPGSSVDISPQRFSISKLAPGGEWSTFGRNRNRRMPDAHPPDNPEGTPHPRSTKDSKHLSTDSILSTFTLSRLTRPSRTSPRTHDVHSSPSTRSPQQSPGVQFNSKQSSPANTMSSKRHPRTPLRPSSYIAPTSVTNLTTYAPQEPADSPHTFGHPTPPDKPVKFSTANPSPPPPLPPLSHPELASAFPLLTNPMSAGQPTGSVFRDRSNTLPTRRHTPRKDDLFPSLSLRLSRSVRRQPSSVNAKQAPSAATSSEQQETRPSHTRRRVRTDSGGARQRRTSADWSSYQASVGVTSHANQAWPAQVSREILRLSLSGQDQFQGSSITRGGKDPVFSPDQSVSAPSSLPFPHPSRPSSPAPFRASATLKDGRETISLQRLHSLQSNRRSSKLLDRFTMAEVKRSLSAIEARTPINRPSGATHYASSGLTDPVPTSSGVLQASLAPTPSRSLFSGRVLPANPPAPSSMRDEPSTPTPEPRHLSDKSRGKRKAEDNIDLTPPEQKKEGQRATFLLPSESRSQRVSSSSHAPSSYHRKRARLSSTSPFATPVQSRPASVHETPRSGSRSHHFTSLSSSTGAHLASRTPSRAASTRSRQPPTPSTTRKHERRLSISQASIPISAYISPHAPSISRSTKFHMRDPRKPPKKPSDTPWGLRFATEDEPGSPIQAWCFFLGFLLFPVWWIAGLLLRVPRTRIAGDGDAEKGVTIDDPQIEHDAKVWRFRCRMMAVVSLFTYVPFIVLVAIFAPR